MIYYYVEKMAVYSHGVYWIGTDYNSGVKVCNDCASCDYDDYHTWELKKKVKTTRQSCKDYWSDDEIVYSTTSKIKSNSQESRIKERTVQEGDL